MKRILFLFVILNLILIPGAFAKQGHMKLLAVRETESGSLEGGIADLYLEINPGSGRVFLETFPLTRTDTQMSTRFAKAIACDAIDNSCDDVDFFYTITADSPVVAGPSAGAAIAVLTIALLEDMKLNEDYAITGTINSGGLIGPVGGLKAKVEAAKKAGLKKVFIPAGEVIVKFDNRTIDLSSLSKELDIEIIEISELNDAVREFTGREISKKFKSIEISDEYTSTMKALAKSLCDRSNRLKEEAKSLKVSANITSMHDNAKNLTGKGKDSFEKKAFYSSASYCFGANVEYSAILLLSKNLSNESILLKAAQLNKDARELRSKIDSFEKKTITDLQAYIVVKERLEEAEDAASQAVLLINKTNRVEVIARALAYAEERINSAYSWYSFMGKEGKVFNLNKDILKKSCQSKISEADERKQYVELYFPNAVSNVDNGIKRAGTELEKGNYELCLSIASRAKADVDIILSVFGVESSQLDSLVERKLEIVKNSIARQAAKGTFPILGYSYYEYANSLKENDVFSALLYSEYALELGNLDIYFKESNGKKFRLNVDSRLLAVFLIGIFVGAAAVLAVRARRTRLDKAKEKRLRKKK
ncbi:hypothetical protein HYS31_06010 [Candidatus Woesearchaeota archaeon]|nr:hypothetical protein [Candidatus Woesearchaeota archaeon]